MRFRPNRPVRYQISNACKGHGCGLNVSGSHTVGTANLVENTHVQGAWPLQLKSIVPSATDCSYRLALSQSKHTSLGTAIIKQIRRALFGCDPRHD
jgi:hypothetical protein